MEKTCPAIQSASSKVLEQKYKAEMIFKPHNIHTTEFS